VFPFAEQEFSNFKFDVKFTKTVVLWLINGDMAAIK